MEFCSRYMRRVSRMDKLNRMTARGWEPWSDHRSLNLNYHIDIKKAYDCI